MLFFMRFNAEINLGCGMTTDTFSATPTTPNHNPKIPPNNMKLIVSLLLITLIIFHPDIIEVLDMIKNMYIS